MKAILYYMLNFTFPKLEKEIIKIVKNRKKLIVFDVGCYRGVFTKTILKSIKKKI
jgi:phospholipid N-methyltransferase